MSAVGGIINFPHTVCADFFYLLVDIIATE
jgi:hypothetical protein